MDKVYIHWNVTNFITIVLMGAVGFVIIGFASQLWKNKKSNNNG